MTNEKGERLMADSDEREFIREKIMDQAGGKQYRIHRLLKLIAMAGLFGLVASLFFVLGKTYLEPRLTPDVTVPTETISFGRDTEADHGIGSAASLENVTEPSGEAGESGVQAESTLPAETEEQTPEPSGEAESETTLSESEAAELLRQQIESAASSAASEAVSQGFLEQDPYLALAWYRRISSMMKDMNKGLVTISSMTQDTDWFDNPVSNANQSSGAILYITDSEVLILADYGEVKEAEALTVTFCNGRTVEARIKKSDSITGIAIVSVSSGAITEDTASAIRALTLGNSYQVLIGSPVVAGGSPIGRPGSLTAGMVALVEKNTVGTDTAFYLLYSDVKVGTEGSGFLFNMDGEIIGVLTRSYGDQEAGFPVAIGISGLKGIIECLSRGSDAAYLGIQGQNVTAEISEMYEMPEGIYVTKVIVDSPAYVAGVKAGDILVASGDNQLNTIQKLQTFLEKYTTGDVIPLTVYRSGQEEYVELEFEAVLGAR